MEDAIKAMQALAELTPTMNPVVALVMKVKQSAELSAEIEALKVRVIEEVGPYKIGDTTTVKGYAHEGKQCRITGVYLKISLLDTREAIDIKVTARVLKKDGSESGNYADWSSWNDPLLAEAIHKIAELAGIKKAR